MQGWGQKTHRFACAFSLWAENMCRLLVEPCAVQGPEKLLSQGGLFLSVPWP